MYLHETAMQQLIQHDMSDAALGARFLSSKQAKDIPQERTDLYAKAWRTEETCEQCGKLYPKNPAIAGTHCNECLSDFPF